MSENLKEIVDNGTLQNTADVVIVTSLVTQIADSLNGFQRNEAEVHTFSHYLLLSLLSNKQIKIRNSIFHPEHNFGRVL